MKFPSRQSHDALQHRGLCWEENMCGGEKQAGGQIPVNEWTANPLTCDFQHLAEANVLKACARGTRLDLRR